MYLENFGNPKNFVRIARRVTKKKPVIAVKAGRTEAGGRATASHTGSLGGGGGAPQGPVTPNRGLPGGSLQGVFGHPVAVAPPPPPRGEPGAVVEGAKGSTKTVLCNFLGRSEESPGFVELVTNSIPSYLFPESAAGTLAAMHRHQEYLERDEGTFPTFEVDRKAASRTLAAAKTAGRTRLREVEATDLLRAYGFQTAATRAAADEDAAVAAAIAIGYPVVVKAV